MTVFGPMIDVRHVFPVERAELLRLLRSLSPREWALPTVCPGWDVHDIVGHVLNDHLRRISGSRDGFAGAVFTSDETLPAYLARVNDEFVRATRQLSPLLMIELLDYLGPGLDQVWSAMDLTGPAALDVSWAGPGRSPAWLDIARDYTEFWVHQQQIRDAVSRPGANQPELVHPVLDTFCRALPHALRQEARPEGTIVRLHVTGVAGAVWSVVRDRDRWRMDDTGPSAQPPSHDGAVLVSLDQDDLWRLTTRGITVAEARQRATFAGDADLADAVTSLLAVVA